MKERWYCRAGLRRALILLQVLCLAAIGAAVLNLSYWLDGNYDLRDMAMTFEQSSRFLELVDSTVRLKIECAQNSVLFESDGEEDLTKLVDIRLYADSQTTGTGSNLNTSYRLSDLIAFHESGETELREAIASAGQGGNWNTLTEETKDLETILPASGGLLADYSRISSNPYGTLLEYYQKLCDTASDVARRYDSYQREAGEPEGEANTEAPSNIVYFIENTGTKEYYTNLDAKNLTAARRAVGADEALTWLFEGERSFNIMVANSERVLNSEAGEFFIDDVFLGSSERVLLAVNLNYPAGDSLQEAWRGYEKREPQVNQSLVMLGAALLVIAVTLGILIAGTGKDVYGRVLPLKGFDRIPAEIALGILILLAILSVFFLNMFAMSRRNPSFQRLCFLLPWFALYGIAAWTILAVVRWVRSGELWKNSVVYAIYRVTQSVYAARQTSRRLVVVAVLLMAANFFFLRFLPGIIGSVAVLTLDLAVVLNLMRDEVGKRSVYEGLSRLSKGELTYKIDTEGLTGDSLTMAAAVNEMGDGLQEAVDSIVKGERMKTELITNVSHDLKTPLTSIISYVGLLKRPDITREEALKYVDVLDRKTERLKVLISDLIDASRISSGNVHLDMATLDVRLLLMQAEGEFSDRLEERGITCALTLPPASVKIRADGSQLWRVLENLFGNAAKYARENSPLRVTLTAEDGQVRMSFVNQPQETLAKSGDELVERFTRGDLSRSSEGSGLGLSIAKNLTELMGGTFCVTTEPDEFRAELGFAEVTQAG